MRPVRFRHAGRVAVAASLVAVLTLPGGGASASGTGHSPGYLRISSCPAAPTSSPAATRSSASTASRRAGALRVTLNGADVTTSFAVGRRRGRGPRHRAQDRPQRAAGGAARPARAWGAAITLTNHPIGGPVFAGPQVQPWDCDLHRASTGLGGPGRACNTPTVYRWLYKSTAGGGAARVRPGEAGDRVATTTTDAGAQVPFVVRREPA